MKDIQEVAKKAYNAYGGVTDFKNFQGNPMPKWEELPPKIQEAWQAACNETLITTFGSYKDLFNDRERLQMEHAASYANKWSDAGVPGHGQFVLIAKLARLLGFVT